jgi:hypothetical protein
VIKLSGYNRAKQRTAKGIKERRIKNAIYTDKIK